MNIRKNIFVMCLMLSMTCYIETQDQEPSHEIECNNFRLLKDQVSSWIHISKKISDKRVQLLATMSIDPKYNDDKSFQKSCKNSEGFIKKVLSNELSSLDRDAYIERNAQGWFVWQKKICKKKGAKSYKEVSEILETFRLGCIGQLREYVEMVHADYPTKKSRDDFKMHVMISKGFSKLNFSMSSEVDEDILPIVDFSGMPFDKIQFESSLRINELMVRTFDARDNEHLERIIIKNAEVFAVLYKKIQD